MSPYLAADVLVIVKHHTIDIKNIDAMPGVFAQHLKLDTFNLNTSGVKTDYKKTLPGAMLLNTLHHNPGMLTFTTLILS